MLDVGCWMLDVGCWMLDVGFIQNSEFKIYHSPLPLGIFGGGFDNGGEDFLNAGCLCEEVFRILGAENPSVAGQAEPVDGFAGLFRRDSHLGLEIRPALRGLGFFDIRADACPRAPKLGGKVVFLTLAHGLCCRRDIEGETIAHFQNRVRFFHSKFSIENSKLVFGSYRLISW